MKSKITSVRFKLADYFKLEEKAQKLGINVSDYIRQAAMNAKITTKQIIAPGDTRAIYNCFNNLNQAMKLANSYAQKQQDDEKVIDKLNEVVEICEATREELKNFLQERK
jgi:ribbon-helix-helix protein, copG family